MRPGIVGATVAGVREALRAGAEKARRMWPPA